MSEAATFRRPRGWWIRLPVELASTGAELALSRRGLSVAYLVVALGFATGGWIRPPLSEDIRGLHISWGRPWPRDTPADGFLRGPRPTAYDGVGALLVTMILAGTAAVLWRPGWLGTVAGVLLCGAMAANAAVALNHPCLIEALDREYEQRQQIVIMLGKAPEQQPLADLSNGRIDPARGAPVADEQRADLSRGWIYLQYGQWLVPWAAAGVLLGGRGRLWRRFGALVAWVILAAGLAGAVCSRRLLAEADWLRAGDLEARSDFDAARRALQAAVARFPEFDRLERTWLLMGKLDHFQGLSTPQMLFFRAYQLAREGERSRSVAYREDIPWLIAGVPDSREVPGLPPPGAALPRELPGVTVNDPAGVPSAGFGTSVGLARMDMGPPVADRPPEAPAEGRASVGHRGPARPLRPPSWTRSRARELDLRRAVALMDELLSQEGEDQPAVRHQAARCLIDLGLHYYLQAPILTDGGLDNLPQDRQLMAAQAAWQRASRIDPARVDCASYLGLVRARIDGDHPDLVEGEFATVLAGLADRPLHADVLSTLGDVYMRAGRMAEARLWYARSFDLINVPEIKNYRAQKGLGGL